MYAPSRLHGNEDIGASKKLTLLINSLNSAADDVPLFTAQQLLAIVAAISALLVDFQLIEINERTYLATLASAEDAAVAEEDAPD